jgi:hypothetical protein
MHVAGGKGAALVSEMGQPRRRTGNRQALLRSGHRTEAGADSAARKRDLITEHGWRALPQIWMKKPERDPVSQAGMTGMRRAADDILAVGATPDEREWQTPSAAAGWSVHDNIIHLGCLLELLQAAVRGEPVPDSKLEPPNDIKVADRRDWETSRTVDNLQKQLDQTLRLFAALQEEPMASVQTPMLDLGAYPLHAIADMFTFDMTAHLRYDILAPGRPITRDSPPLDEIRLSPSVAWLLCGIPQMQPHLAHHLTAPLALHLTGPGAQEVLLRADGDAITMRPHRPTDDVPATLTSTTSAGRPSGCHGERWCRLTAIRPSPQSSSTHSTSSESPLMNAVR